MFNGSEAGRSHRWCVHRSGHCDDFEAIRLWDSVAIHRLFGTIHRFEFGACIEVFICFCLSVFLFEYILSVDIDRVNKLFSTKKELTPEIHTAVHFLYEFIEAAGLSREVLEKSIPEVILNQLEYLTDAKI